MIDICRSDITPADYGYWHESELPDYDHMRDMLNGVLDSLYTTGRLDVLEQCLEELCHQLDIELPEKTLKFDRNQEKINQDITWLDYRT